MYYLIYIFFIIYKIERNHNVFHSFLLTLTIFPGIFYIVSIFGGKLIFSYKLDIIFLGILILFLVYLSFKNVKNLLYVWKQNFQTLTVEWIFFMMMPIASFFYFFYITKDSLILPVHDPITVPTLAKIIFNSGNIPQDLSPLSSQNFTYPPGFSIFISLFYSFGDPLFVLLIFKYLNIIVVSFTPAIWSVYLKKIYSLDFVNTSIIIICFYYGFFFFDRSLPFAFAFAGKNSSLYVFFLFPIVFYQFLKNNETVSKKTIIIVSVLGLTVIHYSFLFMFSILLFFHILFNFGLEKQNVPKYIFLFICSVILFLPFYLNIKNDHLALGMRNGSFHFALIYIKKLIFSFDTPIGNFFFWIFNGIGTKWTYKKIFILLFFLIPTTVFVVKLVLKKNLDKSEKKLFKVISIFFSCIIACLMIIFIFLIKPLASPESIRWFAFYYFAILASFFFVFLCYFLLKKNNIFRKSALFFLCCFITVFHVYGVKDFQLIASWVKSGNISSEKMRNLHNILIQLTHKNG